MKKPRKFKNNSMVSKLKKAYLSYEKMQEVEVPLVRELNKTQRFK